ncbi:SDR family NAD(P)-dependent oxidoreductase [Pedobacter sp. L105]|uniref:SDR family NAD(P)-dependent oxidoreductase n=1 Tax=Pedobacter sp. L105 TaxID=1641871 RepID=UPI00131D56DF|nr:SDR family NAD(P)-dependent oxidoreductase [Pedobacter sp. L105]
MEKVIVITGGNAGLGLETARILAQDKNITLILGCRDQVKAQKAVAELKTQSDNPNIRSLELDLASFASIKLFAMEVAAVTKTIDVLACNAGMQIAHGTQTTAEGFEKTFGINYLGHFLLTKLLMPLINKDSGRITLVSSGTHFRPAIWQGKIFGIPPGDYVGWKELSSPGSLQKYPEKSRGYARYSTSKLCVLFFGYELDRRLKEKRIKIKVNLYDPGLMPGTDLARESSAIEKWAWRNIMPVLRIFDGVFSVKTSAKNFAKLLNDPTINVSGQYFEGPKHKKSSDDSYDQTKWKDLWNGGEQLIKQQFDI